MARSPASASHVKVRGVDFASPRSVTMPTKNASRTATDRQSRSTSRTGGDGESPGERSGTASDTAVLYGAMAVSPRPVERLRFTPRSLALAVALLALTLFAMRLVSASTACSGGSRWRP